MKSSQRGEGNEIDERKWEFLFGAFFMSSIWRKVDVKDLGDLSS